MGRRAALPTREYAGSVDITAYYSAYMQPGMVDLSRSSPDTLPLPIAPAVEHTHLAAVRPPGGIESLRAAVARHCYTTLDADDVLLCSGASEALVATALALGRTGEPAVAVPGAYPSFTATIDAMGAKRHRGFAPGIKVSCALANNPTVPGGCRFDVARFIEESRAAGAVPVVDEVYRHIVLDEGEVPSAACDVHPAAVSIGDLSKSLGLGGLRVGWVATRNGEVREQIEVVLQLITGGPSVLADAVALAAFDVFDEQIAEHTRLARANAPLVYSEVRRAGWSFSPAALGFTFVACPPAAAGLPAPESARDAGFFVVPCSVLDADEPPAAVRLSVLADPSALRRGLESLA